MNSSHDVCWVITDGKAGTEAQALGLADALALEPRRLRVRLRTPWRQLSPAFRWAVPWAAGPGGDRLEPPWPRLVLSAGRHGIVPALAIRRASGGRSLTVHLQDPRLDPRHFDRLIAPRHDRLEGPNVLTTLGALHRMGPARLAAAHAEWAGRLARLPRPRLAVLIGGDSRAHRLPADRAAELGGQLAALAASGAGLMVTVSRRTRPAARAALWAALDRVPAAAIERFDGSGPNPYAGYLALADAVLVTADSVTMLCEAAATGRPVHLLPLPGGSPKFTALHQDLAARGILRPFDPALPDWRYPPLAEAERIAGLLRPWLAERGVTGIDTPPHADPSAPISDGPTVPP